MPQEGSCPAERGDGEDKGATGLRAGLGAWGRAADTKAYGPREQWLKRPLEEGAECRGVCPGGSAGRQRPGCFLAGSPRAVPPHSEGPAGPRAWLGGGRRGRGCNRISARRREL